MKRRDCLAALAGTALVARSQAQVVGTPIEWPVIELLDGATLAPAAVVRVAGDGEIGVNDVTLVATGTGRGTKSRVTTAWDDHPRVRHARRLRTNVTVYGDDGGFFTLSNGLAGRMEMSIEIT